MRDRTRWLIGGGTLALFTSLDVVGLASGVGWKLFWGYFSAAITVTGYFIYLSQMYPPKGRAPAKPEPLSWVLFGFLTGAGWIIQVSQGGAAGSWCLGVTAGACFVIATWSWLKFNWSFDRWHAVTAACALVLFIFSVVTRRNPAFATLSAVLATLADFVSYGPTFRKAWYRPHEDSAVNYAFNSIKCIPALAALTSYSWATVIYLSMLTVVNGGFAIFLLVWRNYLPRFATRKAQTIARSPEQEGF